MARHRISLPSSIQSQTGQGLGQTFGKLWDAANVIEPLGMILGFTNIGRMQTHRTLTAALGLALLFAGIIIRWTAIYTLGK